MSKKMNKLVAPLLALSAAGFVCSTLILTLGMILLIPFISNSPEIVSNVIFIIVFGIAIAGGVITFRWMLNYLRSIFINK